MRPVKTSRAKFTPTSFQDSIVVSGVSKQYQLGARQGERLDSLREAIMAAALAPWNRLRRLGRTAAAPTADTDLWALKDVSFRVERGEAIGIIGRNGAGKSTLLKILSRITAPTSGELRMIGRVGSLLEVGTGFHPELTGRENVFLNGAIIGMSHREITRKFDQIVDFAEIGRFIDTPVKRYSSGMYVRLAFAVAAHMEPDILLLDEVLSVGDLAFQRKCMEHVKQLQERQVTLLFVSHSMFSIKALCPRSVYLDGGEVAYDGPTDEAIRRYDAAGNMDVASWAQETVGSDPLKCPIYVKQVETLNEDGDPCTLFDHGERIRIRLHFEAQTPIREPNFTIALTRSDDVACCNYSTAMDGFATSTASGPGVIEVRTPPIKLVADVYTINVLVWDAAFQRLYCAQVGGNLHIRHSTLNNQFGVFHEAGEWRWQPEAELTAAAHS